jgi:hypothetical protein
LAHLRYAFDLVHLRLRLGSATPSTWLTYAFDLAHLRYAFALAHLRFALAHLRFALARLRFALAHLRFALAHLRYAFALAHLRLRLGSSAFALAHPRLRLGSATPSPWLLRFAYADMPTPFTWCGCADLTPAQNRVTSLAYSLNEPDQETVNNWMS